MSSLPANLSILPNTTIEETSKWLRTHRGALNFTNGTYTAMNDVVLPTTLAGFNYVHDQIADMRDAFVMAINSNTSLDNAGVDYAEDEMDRALKVLVDLAKQDRDRRVLGVFYDEETPQELYNQLKVDGRVLRSLHKWGGYGIGEDAPVIIGAENFQHVLAFPFQASATPPAFFDKTQTGDQSDVVQVVDLHRLRRPTGQAYMLKR